MHCSAFSTCTKKEVFGGQTEQSRLEDDCVPSFPVFFVEQPMYINRNKTAHLQWKNTEISTKHWLGVKYQMINSLITSKWSGLHKKNKQKKNMEKKTVSEINRS